MKQVKYTVKTEIE